MTSHEHLQQNPITLFICTIFPISKQTIVSQQQSNQKTIEISVQLTWMIIQNKQQSMLPNYQRQGYTSRMSVNHNKIDSCRISSSLSHRVLPNITPSPYSPTSPKKKDLNQSGQKMRLMKSKIGNISIQQKNIINENNLYPAQLIFLLSNEEGNVQHIRKLIQTEKKRVDRDFTNFSQQIIHIIQDLKLSIYAQLDCIFMNFINLYKNMKSQVVKMKQHRRRIIQTRPQEQGDNRSIGSRSQIINNISNANILQQISKDQDYFRNHKIYEQITNAYYQAIGPIMNDAQNILAIGSQVQLYKDQKCNKILIDIRNNFFKDTKQIYQNQLEQLVIQVNNLIQQNNILLNCLTIQQPKFDKIQQNINPYQIQKISAISSMSNIPNQNKKKKYQSNTNQINPYGLFDQPHLKSKNNLYQQENHKSKNLRPTSSAENLRYRTNHSDTQWNTYRDIEQSRKKYITNNNNINQHITKYPQPKITKDQQNIILQSTSTDTPFLTKRNLSITSLHSQDILLCIIFINDGKNIAIGSKDKNIYIHQLITGKLIQILTGHRASVCSLSNFPYFFCSGGDNGCGSLILWQSEQLKMKRKINLHSSALTCIVDLSDGCHLATGGYDRKITVFNYRRGQSVFEIGSGKSGITSMMVCEQVRKLVSAGLDSTLTIWSIIIKNREIDTIVADKIITNCGLVCSIRPITLSPDILLVGNKDGKLLQINVHTGQILKTLKIGRGSVIQIAVIQRRNRYMHPIIITCCNGERQLLITRLETGFTESAKVPINVNLGCGIGPKLVVESTGLIAIVSQNINQKQVALYDLVIG